MATYSALIIDDEPDIRTLICMTLKRMGVECEQAGNVKEALRKLQDHTFHLCITDMKLPDGNGLELIHLMQKRFASMPVAMITAYGNLDLGVKALKAGAFDVLSKPLDTDRLRTLTLAALELNKAPRNTDALPSTQRLLGQSNFMNEVRGRISKIARSHAPVWISGESGTGKELCARLIHHQSSLVHQPFHVIDCAQTPEVLQHALLGTNNEPGILMQGQPATLMFEQIERIPTSVQAQLARWFASRQSDPTQAHQPAIRFISSSIHRPDDDHITKALEHDLLTQLSIVHLPLIPLRERTEDIEILAQHFIQRYAEQWSISAPVLENSALTALKSHPYFDNIKELQTILQQAVTFAEQDCIRAQDLNLNPIMPEIAPIQERAILTNNLEEYLENIERSAIVQALESVRWNKTAAAEKLGISFRTLRYRCKKLGID